jgi:hypothetical protein
MRARLTAALASSSSAGTAIANAIWTTLTTSERRGSLLAAQANAGVAEEHRENRKEQMKRGLAAQDTVAGDRWNAERNTTESE